MFLGVLLDERMREHRQHELALHIGQHLQQLREVLLVEGSVVMGAVRPHIGRIDEVERTLAVVPLEQVDPVLAFDGAVVQTLAQHLGEIVCQAL